MRRRDLVAGLFALVLGLAPAARAQQVTDPTLPSTAPSAGDVGAAAGAGHSGIASLMSSISSQAGAVEPSSYVLGPGDMLMLEIWGAVDKFVPLEIDPEGRVFLPGVGPVFVSGVTLATARRQLLAEVDRRYRGVKADLRLTRTRRFKVYITGTVRNPGGIEAAAVMRASEAIGLVGLQADASRRNIQIRHHDGTLSRVDLTSFEAAGLTLYNPFLLDGDVLHVPPRKQSLQIEGAVPRPGSYEYAPTDSLRSLIAFAGGLLPSARHDSLLIVRFLTANDRDSLWIAEADVMSGRSNPALQPDDHVFVYYRADWHQMQMASIYGEVERPGVYPFVLGRDRLGDLLAWAGGFREHANQEGLYLTRISAAIDDDPGFQRLARLSRAEMTESEYATFETKLSERRNAFRVDFHRISAGGGDDVNPLLESGDVVRVDRVIQSVRVEGQVRRPGFIEYRPGRTISDYIQLAGGFTSRASRSKIRIARQQTGQVFPAHSVQAVQPGDFLWVPEVRDLDAWQLFKDILTIGGQVALIVVTVNKL